jgi:hypothetical protein
MGLLTAAPCGLRRKACPPPRASLLPKVRDHFAEFLNQGSLVRLGLLDLSTGVGVRYGRWVANWQAFRDRPGVRDLAAACALASCSLLGQRHGGTVPPYQLESASSALSRSPSVSHQRQTPAQRCRNLDLLSIAYALPPRLRPDSPAADRPCSGNLGYAAVGVRTPRIVTHPDIRTRLRSPRAPAHGSLLGDAPLPLKMRKPHPESCASAVYLAPVHCRRGVPRPVSCYALFQGWLLLSQPPGCLSDSTSLPTEHTLGGLSGRSGLLPF